MRGAACWCTLAPLRAHLPLIALLVALFVHYGEEHWNDDGLTLLPKIVEETARYRPSLVTMSGDKDNDGTRDQLGTWKQIMSPYDSAGVPYLAGIGNHDRTTPLGVPPGTAGLITPGVQGSLENYRQVFSDRPYPFGDAAASSPTAAAATCRTSSTVARAASSTPRARSEPTTATGTASGCCASTPGA